MIRVANGKHVGKCMIILSMRSLNEKPSCVCDHYG